MRTNLKLCSWGFAMLLSLAQVSHADEVELKDLINIRGVRTNKLVGYGLVFGLNGTGDSAASLTTRKAAATMLSKMGVTAKPEEVVTGNFASVIVTADLPPFARNGDYVDVRLSAQGDAKSLTGGTLLLTPMRAGDGQVYAVAQGAVTIGQQTGGVTVPTVGSITRGAMVEREVKSEFAANGKLQLSLRHSDFTTNDHITKRINNFFKGFYARSIDPSTIDVEVPPDFVDDVVSFVSRLEKLTVAVDRKAIVVVNERTGTVVMGKDVTVQPITIAHGSLSIRIKSGQQKETETQALMNIDTATVGGLVEALNKLGVKPNDLVGIIQAMHAAGALNAELQFI